MDAVIVEDVYKRYPKYKRYGPGTALGRAHWVMATLYRLKGRGYVEALRGVSFRVTEGEIFCIIGPNGAGKTTLMKCIGAMLIPDRGYIEVARIDVVKNPLKAKKKITVVGSGHWAGFDWSLTLVENLILFGLMYGYSMSEARSKAKEILDVVGLSEKANDRPSKLSSGERQRLSLARGFIAETPVFLIDEPTVGLDPEGAKQVRDYIKSEFKKQGYTLIFTTHFMYEAEYLADRIAIMDRGKIIEIGSPEELKLKFIRGKVIDIKALNVYKNVLEKLRSLDVINIDYFYRFGGAEVNLKILTKKPYEILEEAIDIILSHRGSLIYADVREPTLEDVYRIIFR